MQHKNLQQIYITHVPKREKNRKCDLLGPQGSLIWGTMTPELPSTIVYISLDCHRLFPCLPVPGG